MPPKLRSRPPYFCRYKDPATSKLCLAVLTEADGKSCPACTTAEAAAREVFFERPIMPALSSPSEPVSEYRRIWP